MLWVSISPQNNVSVLLGVAYRPDRGKESYVKKICNSIDSVDTENVILFGDFNFRDIDWVNREAASEISRMFLGTVKRIY